MDRVSPVLQHLTLVNKNPICFLQGGVPALPLFILDVRNLISNVSMSYALVLGVS